VHGTQPPTRQDRPTVRLLVSGDSRAFADDSCSLVLPGFNQSAVFQVGDGPADRAYGNVVGSGQVARVKGFGTDWILTVRDRGPQFCGEFFERMPRLALAEVGARD
jgi:hypothetical protein